MIVLVIERLTQSRTKAELLSLQLQEKEDKKLRGADSACIREKPTEVHSLCQNSLWAVGSFLSVFFKSNSISIFDFPLRRALKHIIYQRD